MIKVWMNLFCVMAELRSLFFKIFSRHSKGIKGIQFGIIWPTDSVRRGVWKV